MTMARSRRGKSEFHAGGDDRNRRTGRRVRRHAEEQLDVETPTQTALDLNFREAATQARSEFFRAIEEAEAGNKSVDDVHSRDA